MVVCKWRVLEPYEEEYITYCGKFWKIKKETPAQQGIEFCPYCGRPIELDTPSKNYPIYDLLRS